MASEENLKIITSLPFSSLRLLVSPLRLMSAFLWQVAEHHSVGHYEKLEEFVTLVSSAAPEHFYPSQTTKLIIQLRTRMILECYRAESPVPAIINSHLAMLINLRQSCSDEEIVKYLDDFFSLIQNTLENPSLRQVYFQTDFPLLYGPEYEVALEGMVLDFLSRVELLLPSPDLRQTALWLRTAPSDLEDCSQVLVPSEDLRNLLKLYNTKHITEEAVKDAAIADSPASSFEEEVMVVTLPASPGMIAESFVIANEPHEVVSCNDAQGFEGVEYVSEEEAGQEEAGPSEEMVAARTLEDSMDPSCDGQPESESPKASQEIYIVQNSGGHSSCEVEPESVSQQTNQAIYVVQNPENHLCDGQPESVRQQANQEMYVVQNSEDHSLCEVEAESVNQQTDQEIYIVQNPGDHLSSEVESESVSQELYVLQSSDDRSCDGPPESVSRQARQEIYVIQQPSAVGEEPSSSASNVYVTSPVSRRHSLGKKGVTPLSVEKWVSQIGKVIPLPFLPCLPKSSIPRTRSARRSRARESRNGQDKTQTVTGEGRTEESQETPKHNDEYVCEHCGKSFPYRCLLDEHALTHTARESFQCSVCGKMFRSRSFLTIHEKIHSNVRPFECSICNKAFRKHADVIKHQLVHTGEKPFKCSVCGNGFTQRSYLKIHQACHTSDQHYPCPHCGKTFPTAFKLRMHERYHTMERPHHCPTCGKTFIHLSMLKRHMGYHAGKRQYLCSLCGKAFVHHFDLTKHQKLHRKPKQEVPCSQCEKVFASPEALRCHMRTHTGEQPYQCQECGKSFTQQGNMRRHMRVHTGERPFTCIICNKSFKHSSHLKDHSHIHTGAWPYQCADCGKTFRFPGPLKKHQRSHAGPQESRRSGRRKQDSQ